MALGMEGLSKIFRFYPFTVPETGRPSFSRKTVKWMTQSKYFCSIEKARKGLGYRPEYDLKRGIEETVAWYRENKML
jgi:UDP-glucose 4-epimerase